MKKSTITISAILISILFVLACSSANLPSLATATPQTIVTMPPMPSDFITQPPSQTESTQTGTGLENENLVAGLPDGFKIGYQAEDGNQTITEMVAEDETVEDWTIMVTVQVYLGEMNTTPQQAQETMTNRWFGACQNSETYPVADGAENGYNFVLWMLYCPLNPSAQKEEFTYMKAIQGNDSFYLVQVAFRYKPTEADITQWMNYLREVQVCDSRIPERGCQ